MNPEPSPRPTRRQFLIRSAATGGLLILGPGALAACAGDGGENPNVAGNPGGVGGAGGTAASGNGAASEAGSPQRGGTLTFARQTDPLGVDPLVVGDNEAIWTISNQFERLYRSSADGGLEPCLAADHSLSDDKLAWTFNLRPGVKFSDGTPLTAADVKFSIDRSSTAEGSLNEAIDEVEVADDHTIVVHTKYPAEILGVMSFYRNGILPKDFGGRSEQEFFDQPVGTGPFHMTNWEVGSRVVLTRNDNYWQEGKPYLDEVVLTAVSSTSTRTVQLRGRQADIIEAPEWSQVESLAAQEDLRVESFPSTILFFLLLNTTVKELSDLNVRRAINLGIDRTAILQAALFGNGDLAGSMFSPTWPGFDTSLTAPARDLVAAKEALAQSAYPSGFSISYAVDGGDTVQATVAQRVQNDLAELGITVTIEQFDAGTLWDMIDAKDYGIVHRKLSLDILDSRANLPTLVDPAVEGYGTVSGYDDPEVLDLVNQVAKVTDEDEAAALYRKIQQALAADLPFLPLYYLPWSYAMSDRVQGFQVPPTGDYQLENVWLSS